MDHFCVLLVDNDLGQIIKPAEREFPPKNRRGIRLRTALNRKDAESLVSKEFFHLALIDPRLGDNDQTTDGFYVLKTLKKIRPACTRFLLTFLERHDFEGAPSIVQKAHPAAGDAQGILLKNDISNHFRALIQARARHWLRNALKVVGAEAAADLMTELYRRRNKKTKSRITVDEIDYLVSRIFGQGESWNVGKKGLGISRVELEPFDRQGLSLARVFHGTCYSGADVRGIRCILKIAGRDYIEHELLRYSQYVRYRIGVDHRVELLGWAVADNLGVLCYNYASPITLNHLFLEGDPRFERVLHALFSPERKSWYMDRGRTQLAGYFKECYRFGNEQREKNLVDINNGIDQLHRRLRENRSGDPANIRSIILRSPREVLGQAIFNDLLPGCIVHGDLHGDNVLVGETGEHPKLIDYNTVAMGPRTIDFATLEASLRVLSLKRRNAEGRFDRDPRTDNEILPEVLALTHDEKAVWKAVWRDARPVENPGAEVMSWKFASYKLGRLARENFDKDDPPLDEREYAATCLLWAVRMFRHPDVSQPRDRARLIVWMSHLVEVLQRPR